MTTISFLDRITEGAVNLAFDLAMRINRRRYWPSFVAAAADPGGAQRRTLARILAENADTTFGRRHGFADLDGADAFRRAVPVHDYEALRPLIEEQELTGAPTLTAAEPVLYAQTSGTSGTPKYLPITADGVARVARIQRLFAGSVHAGTDMFAGKIVGIGSPAVEGHLPGGTPFGSASGMVYEGMPSVVRRKYVLEPEVLAIADHDVRYEVMAALCLAERDVTGVATANPSTLLRLRSMMIDRWDDLIEGIATGRLAVADRLDAAERRAVGRRLPGDPRRAAELRALADRHGTDVGFGHIWPRLAAVTTWTGGSAGFALGALAPHLGESARVVELGYSASEVRGTIGIDPITNRCVPLVEDNYYEFVDRHRREDDDRPLGPDDFLGLDELVEGGRYHVYVTTFDGLYRYDMHDIVEVTGRFEATPTLAFVQKGRGVTNITGEKLTESQVLDAVEEARAALGVTLAFFILLADEARARYRLYTEEPDGGAAGAALAAAVDEALAAANIEYGSKRASGRLGPIAGHDLAPGTAEAYRSACVADGQRDAQFKYLHLQYRNELVGGDFSFDDHRLPTDGRVRS